MDQLLAALAVLPLDRDVDEHYAENRTRLERNGTPIGSHGLFTAAHASSVGMPLVMRNVREFERVPGLKVEAWPEAAARLCGFGYVLAAPLRCAAQPGSRPHCDRHSTALTSTLANVTPATRLGWVNLGPRAIG